MEIIKKNTTKKIYKHEPIYSSQPDQNWNHEQFINRLSAVEEYLRDRNKFQIYGDKKIISCNLCSQKNISKGTFHIGSHTWDQGLSHYIRRHQYKPSEEFI